jgi:hypothetical protein
MNRRTFLKTAAAVVTVPSSILAIPLSELPKPRPRSFGETEIGEEFYFGGCLHRRKDFTECYNRPNSCPILRGSGDSEMFVKGEWVWGGWMGPNVPINYDWPVGHELTWNKEPHE